MYRGAGNAWLPPPPTQDGDSPAPAPPPSQGLEAPQPTHPEQQGEMQQYSYYPTSSAGYDRQLYFAPGYPPPAVPPQGDPYATAPPQLPAPLGATAAASYLHQQPVYSTVHYAHDRMFSAVESARWMGSLDDSFGSLHYPTSNGSSGVTASGVHGHGHASQSGSGSDEPRGSGESTSDSPRVGALGLPIEDDPSLPPPEVKPFVQKLFNMLSDPEHYQDVILWNHTGDAFFVAHNDRFINEVLPTAFGHSNVHSFTRQLNVYNFQRMNVAQLRSALDLQGGVAGAYSGWSHPHFRRGDSSTLAHLTPRPSRARLIRKLEKQYGGSSASTSASTSASASSGTSSAASSIGPISPRSSATTRLTSAPTHVHPHPRPQAPISHPPNVPDPPYP